MTHHGAASPTPTIQPIDASPTPDNRTDAPDILSLERLSVGYTARRRKRTVVLAEIGASMRGGELVCLIGPNGAGKSTLLRTLVGAQAPLSGSVRLDGDDLTRLSPRERAQRLSAVFTDGVDAGFLKTRALVGLGRSPRLGWFSSMSDEDDDIVEWALAAAGASELADRPVAELSDGETQRVMIARALAQQPSLLVLDEPTAFLDLTRRVELTALLRRLVAATGLAVLMSTHDLELALRLADQIWLVHPDSRFETGAPEDLALTGSINAAYASTDVEFDHDAGTFVIADTTVGPRVAVTGTEPAATWARRTVVRAGWTPTTSIAPDGSIAETSLHITSTDRDIHWRLSDATGSLIEQGDRFARLASHLRQRSKAPINTSQPASTPEKDHIT